MDSTQPQPPRRRKPNDTCDLPDCDAPFHARGRCRRHYQQWCKTNPPETRAPAARRSRFTVSERFWRKVQRGGESECWPWTGRTTSYGHGQFWISPDRGQDSAHAFALELATGQRRPDGQHCCHHCDNPICCNPAHLYYGTPRQNSADMVKRHRNRRGVEKVNALLSEAQVVEMRTRYFAGETAGSLAREFGIRQGHLSNIVRGRMWKYAPGPVGLKAAPKVTAQQKAEIKAKRAAGAKLAAVAAEYGISQSYVGAIERGCR